MAERRDTKNRLLFKGEYQKSDGRYMYKKYVWDSLGRRKISDIKYSDIKKFYNHLIHDLGFKPNSMETIHTILHPIFSTAVRDGYIRLNPTDGVMGEIKKRRDWEKPKRHALTEQEQEAFVEFVKNHKTYAHWLPLFTVMLGTGCRVDEVVGLTWKDCDFKNDVININHSLIYRPNELTGKLEYYISAPKTRAGIREIPMFDAVKNTLQAERLRQMKEGFNTTVIDGYSGFIFSNRYKYVLSPHNVNRAIERIIRDYNLEETEKAKSEERLPLLLPHFSAHNMRHTFCTRMCENETNIKIIQEIMGHADITTTVNIRNPHNEKAKQPKYYNKAY